MGVLQGLQPRRVFEIFEEICAIPLAPATQRPSAITVWRLAKKEGLRGIRMKATM